jgi:hypothetical protein
MEKLISSELTKYLLVLGASAIALYALLVRLVTRTKGSFKPYQRETLLYLICGAILFGGIALFAHPAFHISPGALLMILQAYFLLLGILHLYFVGGRLKLTHPEHDFFQELLLTGLVACFGAACFLILFRRMDPRGLDLFMLGASLFFLVPLLFVETFRKAISIPSRIRQLWHYPVDSDIAEPDDHKLRNLIVISFEFLKDPQDTALTSFRAKAPVEMEFGELFYYFINDYNERHQQSRIGFSDDGGQPFGWAFYKKKGKLSFFTAYVDANKTIRQNGIKENDIIICERS